jgi:hypothetical protein
MFQVEVQLAASFYLTGQLPPVLDKQKGSLQKNVSSENFLSH